MRATFIMSMRCSIQDINICFLFLRLFIIAYKYKCLYLLLLLLVGVKVFFYFQFIYYIIYTKYLFIGFTVIVFCLSYLMEFKIGRCNSIGNSVENFLHLLHHTFLLQINIMNIDNKKSAQTNVLQRIIDLKIIYLY